MDHSNDFFHGIPGDQLYIAPFDAQPTEGYEAPTNFPDCCPLHRSCIKEAEIWFEKFPNCCDNHRKMAEAGRIMKSDYEGLPRKIVNQLAYTEHHIAEQIATPEWYEDITNYIDYNWWSFGQPPIGFAEYCLYLKHYIKTTSTEIPDYKRERLIEYIEGFGKKVPFETDKHDLNLLYNTYQKWLKSFPFGLQYFNGLKEQIEGIIPVFKDPPKFNPYTGMAKGESLTQSELIDSLAIATKHLLKEVHADKLYAAGHILDIEKHRIEIANERLRIDEAKILEDYSKGEMKYMETLKKWLKVQKDYFKDIAAIVTKRAAVSAKSIQKPLALFYYYQHQSGDLKPFTKSGLSKTAEIHEIATKHKVSAKNFELAYNAISGKPEKRLSNAGLRDFEAAVNMLSDYPKAQALAIQDLEQKKRKDG